MHKTKAQVGLHENMRPQHDHLSLPAEHVWLHVNLTRQHAREGQWSAINGILWNWQSLLERSGPPQQLLSVGSGERERGGGERTAPKTEIRYGRWLWYRVPASTNEWLYGTWCVMEPLQSVLLSLGRRGCKLQQDWSAEVCNHEVVNQVSLLRRNWCLWQQQGCQSCCVF